MSKPKYLLIVCAYLSDAVLANSAQLHQDISIKKDRLSDNEFDLWTSVINSVMSELTSRKFKVIQHGEGKDDHSFYFNFYPVSDSKERFDLVQIRFRISNHTASGQEENTSSTQMFRNFAVNDFMLPADLLQLMNKVGAICDKLKLGDYSSITKL